MKSFRIFTVLLLFPLVATADWLREEAAIMGTAISVELWHADADQGRALIRRVMDEMHRIDDLMSTYKPDYDPLDGSPYSFGIVCSRFWVNRDDR